MDEANTPQLNICDDAERALLTQVASGEQSALVALYQRYQRPLFAYLLRLVRDEGLAEEVLARCACCDLAGARPRLPGVRGSAPGSLASRITRRCRQRAAACLPQVSPEECDGAGRRERRTPSG